jgi:hypothetical protein
MTIKNSPYHLNSPDENASDSQQKRKYEATTFHRDLLGAYTHSKARYWSYENTITARSGSHVMRTAGGAPIRFRANNHS